ncbi:MAG: DUF6468 domain-containing protein [Alphaproteobacteria bacterium]
MMGLAIDILVSVLLVVTIGYAAVLNRRLKRLRDEEDIMRATVQELINSSALADRALKELRAMAETSDAVLKARLMEAETMTGRLDQATERSNTALSRLGAAGVPIPDAPKPTIRKQAEQLAVHGSKPEPDTVAVSPAFANLRESALRLSARAQQ